MGHPSGFIKAFANMYEDISKILSRKNQPVLINHAEGMKFLNFALNLLKKKMAQKYKV